MNNLDKPHKLDLQSASSAQINLDALYQIAPQCFTEVRNPKTGRVSRSVDFSTLRKLLGDTAIEAPNYEAYQFSWVGKHDARAEAARPTDKTLRPITADSLCWDTTRNLYIEGDNLEVLKLLQKSYQGKVKMIYIDPPYNTGNDFVYRDNFAADKSEYLEAAGATDSLGNRYIKNTDTNGRYHSDWCSMIYSRLMVARTLLSDDGVIFISIDDNEVHNLRKICDELFGEGNFVNCFITRRYDKNLNRQFMENGLKTFNIGFEYILCYSKNNFLFNPVFKDASEERSTSGYWKGFWNDADRPTMRYDILGVTPETGQWKWSKDVAYEAVENYKEYVQKFSQKISIEEYWLQTGKTKKFIRRNLNGKGKNGGVENWIAPSEGILRNTNWTDILTSKHDESTQGLFDFPKNVDLIKLILESATDKSALILDFFSGSSTTAHAVMQLNAEDGGSRRYIMVQLPEETPEGSEARKAGYTDIPSIAKERIRRAGAKIKTELQEQIEKAQKEVSATQEKISAEQGKMLNDEVLNTLTDKLAQQQSELKSLQEKHDNLDTGFRVLRLDSSNFQDVYRSPKEYEQGTLEFYEDNIKAERNDLDLLFGCMLSWGVQLSLPMQSEVVEGKTIYTVNEGDLVACFAHKVSPAVIEAMADKQPLRVIFRDSCFESDADKINIYETFKQKMDWSDQEVFKNIRVI